MLAVANPHDQFFEQVLARQEAAQDFVRHYLPAEVVALLDVTSLEIVKDSFVDAELRAHLSDVLYRVHLVDGRGAYVYLLFEHKSYPERLIAFQLLRYVVRIWEMALQQGEGLAPIVPVVVYHGRVRWAIAASLQELVGVPEALRPYVPDYRYALCDLSRYTDEEMRGAVVLRAALLVLKHIFQPDLRERLPAVMRLVVELGERGTGLEYLETMLRYLSSAAETLTEEDLREVVEEVLAQEGGVLMSTIAEKWVEQGMQRGMQQGLQQGLQQGMQQGLQQGMQHGLERGLVADAREAVVDVWEARFGEVPVEALQVIGRLDNLIVLRQLRKKAATAGSAQELVQVIQTLPASDNGDQGEG